VGCLRVRRGRTSFVNASHLAGPASGGPNLFDCRARSASPIKRSAAKPNGRFAKANHPTPSAIYCLGGQYISSRPWDDCMSADADQFRRRMSLGRSRS